MPRLYYLGRHWIVSSDDFPLFLTCPSCCRSLWLSISILIELLYSQDVIQSTNYIENQQNSKLLLILYFEISSVFLVTILISELIIIWRSLSGSILDHENRSKQVIEILNIRLFLGICQFTLFILGIICVVEEVKRLQILSLNIHSIHSLLVISVLLIIIHFIDVIGLICFYIFFSYKSSLESLIDFNNPNYSKLQAVEKMRLQCMQTCKCIQYLTCNIFGGNHINEDLESVATILTELLYDEGLVEVSFTDIIAGIIVVGHVQRKRMIEKRLIQQEDIESQYYNNNNHHHSCIESKDFIEKIYRYSVYSVAVYSYILRVYMNPCTCCCKFSWYTSKRLWTTICCSCLWRRCRNNNNNNNESDNDVDIFKRSNTVDGYDPCFRHQAAIEDWTQEELQAQLVYSNISNDTKLKPYSIFYDHLENEVIIGIRGTLSLEDCVTDALAEPVRIMANESDERGYERWAHEGMLLAAIEIINDIKKKNILDKISLLHRPNPLNSEENENSQRQIKIVIVGHSLGAGIATLLAILLHDEYSQLQCFAFGCPGAVVDRQTAKDCMSYVTSIVLGTDMICRTSLQSLLGLKMATLDCLSRISTNKMKIFQSVLIPTNKIRLSDYLIEDDEDIYALSLNTDIAETIPRSIRSTDSFQSMIRRCMDNIEVYLRECKKPQLVIAGKVLHICDLMQSSSLSSNASFPLSCPWLGSRCSRKPIQYFLMESSMEKFQEVTICPRMVWDHFPDVYMRELRRLSTT